MFKVILLVLAITFSSQVHAEDQFSLTGTPSLSFNDGNIFLNLGGPALKIEGPGWFGGLSFFPSLRYNSDSEDTTPILGAGPYWGWGKVFLALPHYYYASSWYTSVGVGYKF